MLAANRGRLAISCGQGHAQDEFACKQKKNDVFNAGGYSAGTDSGETRRQDRHSWTTSSA